MRWVEIEQAAPELAGAVRSAFEATLHHVVASVRADGSPRVSGTEVRFFEGDMWMGCMPGSRKASDLRRDPRFALHAAPLDVSMVGGDAKVSGLAPEMVDPSVVARYLEFVGHPGEPDDAVLFRLDLDEVTLTRVADDALVITTWTAERGLREFRRS